MAGATLSGRKSNPGHAASRLQIELVEKRFMGRQVSERVVDRAHGPVAVGRVCQQTVEIRVVLDGLPDRLGLHPSAEAMSTVFEQDTGAVVPAVAPAGHWVRTRFQQL